MSQTPIQVSSISLRRRLPLVNFPCQHCNSHHRTMLEHSMIDNDWNGTLIGCHHTTLSRKQVIDMKDSTVRKFCKKFNKVNGSEEITFVIPLNTLRTNDTERS